MQFYFIIFLIIGKKGMLIWNFLWKMKGAGEKNRARINPCTHLIAILQIKSDIFLTLYSKYKY